MTDNRTEENQTPPKNRGILARDLTAACYAAWKGRNLHAEHGYPLDSHPGIQEAEARVVARIGELEEQVRRQAKVIEQMREAAHRLQGEIAETIEVVGPLPKTEAWF